MSKSSSLGAWSPAHGKGIRFRAGQLKIGSYSGIVLVLVLWESQIGFCKLPLISWSRQEDRSHGLKVAHGIA